MRRLFVALFLLVSGSAAASAADDFPYGSSVSFAAVRNGQKIGHHSLTFQRNGSLLTVSTSIDLSVKFLGLTAYRYTHSAQEIWSAGTFQGLASRTDDNGKKFAIQIRRDGAALKVERSVRPDVSTAATFEQTFHHHEMARSTLPPELLPSTHWNIRQVHQSALVNTQDGTEARVQVAAVGRETIVAANVSIEATRYRYTGDVVMDQWFDGKGRWVKMSFIASDGSTIEYVLQ